MKHQSPARTSGQRELRTYTAASPLEIRTTADGHKQVSGYAIVWNSKSVDLGGFVEICSPKLLDRTLKESPDVLMLRDHKQELLLGRTTAGTLELKTDSKGLAFTLTLPQSAIGDDVAENVRLKNLTACSFGFVTVSDSWAETDDGQVIRTLLDVDLFEISITSFPAYQSTSVNTRSCPANLRTKLLKRDDNDDADDCDCDCAACEAGDCAQCTNPDCDDENCSGCPMQDGQRTDVLRLRRHFQARVYNNR